MDFKKMSLICMIIGFVGLAISILLCVSATIDWEGTYGFSFGYVLYYLIKGVPASPYANYLYSPVLFWLSAIVTIIGVTIKYSVKSE